MERNLLLSALIFKERNVETACFKDRLWKIGFCTTKAGFTELNLWLPWKLDDENGHLQQAKVSSAYCARPPHPWQLPVPLGQTWPPRAATGRWLPVTLASSELKGYRASQRLLEETQTSGSFFFCDSLWAVGEGNSQGIGERHREGMPPQKTLRGIKKSLWLDKKCCLWQRHQG